MRIFLRFRRSELAQPSLRHHLAQQAIEGFGREGHCQGQALFVLGEGDHVEGADQLAPKLFEVRQHQGPNQLAHPVGSEVEADHPIPGVDQPWSQAHRFEELIADLLGVGSMDGVDGAEFGDGAGFGVEAVGLLGAIPAVVAVHGPVAAAEGGDAADPCPLDLLLHLGHETGGAARIGVAAIGDHVHTHVFEPSLGCPVQQTSQVVDVAVHPTVGTEPDQMEAAFPLQQLVCQRVEGWVGVDAAVSDGLADAHQLLADDPTRADGEVADLRVAHLVVGQTHGAAAGFDQGVGVGMPEGVHHRCAGCTNGVVLALRGVAPAIENGQNHGRDRSRLPEGGSGFRGYGGKLLGGNSCHPSDLAALLQRLQNPTYSADVRQTRLVLAGSAFGHTGPDNSSGFTDLAYL